MFKLNSLADKGPSKSFVKQEEKALSLGKPCCGCVVFLVQSLLRLHVKRKEGDLREHGR